MVKVTIEGRTEDQNGVIEGKGFVGVAVTLHGEDDESYEVTSDVAIVGLTGREAMMGIASLVGSLVDDELTDPQTQVRLGECDSNEERTELAHRIAANVVNMVHKYMVENAISKVEDVLGDSYHKCDCDNCVEEKEAAEIK